MPSRRLREFSGLSRAPPPAGREAPPLKTENFCASRDGTRFPPQRHFPKTSAPVEAPEGVPLILKGSFLLWFKAGSLPSPFSPPELIALPPAEGDQLRR